MAEIAPTRKELEAATDMKFVDSHVCDQNQDPNGLFVLRASKESDADPAWILVNVWQADSGDVWAGEADSVGEILRSSTVAISYCPFCGTVLRQEEGMAARG